MSGPAAHPDRQTSASPNGGPRHAGRWAREPEVALALAASMLGDLSDETLEPLLESAMRVDVPAGSTVYRDDDPPRVALVVRGLFRGYFTTDDGREITLRYDRPGDVLGMLLVTAGPMDHWVQAVVPGTLLLIDAGLFRRLAQDDARLAWRVARELGGITAAMLDELRGSFAPVRRRIVHHVLAVHESAADGRGFIRLTQQELADAAGCAREVASRALGELRAEGLIATGRDRIRVLNPARLAAEAQQPAARRAGRVAARAVEREALPAGADTDRR